MGQRGDGDWGQGRWRGAAGPLQVIVGRLGGGTPGTRGSPAGLRGQQGLLGTQKIEGQGGDLGGNGGDERWQ